uniref:Transposon protein, putative, CACTA, En/Spm sub-class n=1 Tax=Oryza sativa subsp. japonica TaxID=39947 RepID=Q2R4L6_ORYSJ|nr:transposon protein, putative, CACTA, En/Spm sub-class [Oryza sativa Japonica Group]
MVDNTKGTEEKGLREEEPSIPIVDAPEPMVPPEDSFDSDVADEGDEYSSPSDPCPTLSPKRRKKGNGEEGDKDCIPPKEGETAPRRSKWQPKKKDRSKDDEVPANTTGSKKSERSAKAKKRRGERSVNRKDEGFHDVTHVSPKGEPLAPKTARAKFSSQCGIINSSEELERSKKFLELAKKNKFPHRLGFAGYAPKVEQWTKEVEEMRKAGLPVVADTIENLSSAQEKGACKPKREKDVLSTALGTPEHGGRVRGVSSKMSWKEGFKHDPHKTREAYKDKHKDEGAVDFERQMMDLCVKHMLLPPPETKEPEPDYPFDDLKENTPHRLHIPIGRSGKSLEAATAIAIPGRTYNEEFIDDVYAKVQPQVVHEGFESYEIDFPTQDGVSVLGDAVDLVILWHKNDISFGFGTDATPPKRKVTNKAEEPEMHKENPVPEVPPEIAVPEVPMEIAVPDVQMEITVAEPEVQFMASVGTDIEEVPGLERDGTEPEIFEDPSPAKNPEVQETPVPEKATTSSEVPRVLRSHDSKFKDENKEKFMDAIHGCQEEKRTYQLLGSISDLSNTAYREASTRCHKQPRGTVLCGYYAYEFLRVNRRYRVYAEDLPRLERRTSFDDTGITNVQRDLCHFIHHEYCHVKGDFFDPESALATSDEFKDLREWNTAMP